MHVGRISKNKTCLFLVDVFNERIKHACEDGEKYMMRDKCG